MEILSTKYKVFAELSNLILAKPGQILWAGRNFNKGGKTSHCFVVISGEENEGFIYGAMLSSSEKFDYLPLENKFFKENHSNGGKFEFPRKPTLFAPRKYIKFEDWAPFFLIGELTDAGIKTVKDVISNLDPEICWWNKEVESQQESVMASSVHLKEHL